MVSADTAAGVHACVADFIHNRGCTLRHSCGAVGDEGTKVCA